MDPVANLMGLMEELWAKSVQQGSISPDDLRPIFTAVQEVHSQSNRMWDTGRELQSKVDLLESRLEESERELRDLRAQQQDIGSAEPASGRPCKRARKARDEEGTASEPASRRQQGGTGRVARPVAAKPRCRTAQGPAQGPTHGSQAVSGGQNNDEQLLADLQQGLVLHRNGTTGPSPGPSAPNNSQAVALCACPTPQAPASHAEPAAPTLPQNPAAQSSSSGAMDSMVTQPSFSEAMNLMAQPSSSAAMDQSMADFFSAAALNEPTPSFPFFENVDLSTVEGAEQGAGGCGVYSGNGAGAGLSSVEDDAIFLDLNIDPNLE